MIKVNKTFSVTKNIKKPSMPGQKPRGPRSKRLIIAALVGILLISGVSAAYFISNNNRIENVVKNGQSVSGKPTGHISKVSYQDDGKTKHRYYVQYEYKVGETTYRVNGQSFSTLQARAKDRASKNQDVTVYYLVDEPEKGIVKD